MLIVDESNRLRYRDVEILRSTSDAVLVRGGLTEGELVCISPLDAVTDGMTVRVLDGDTRMARATPATAPTPGPSSDTPALAMPDAPAPESDTTQAAAVPAPPTGRFDIDPTLSREEQIAAIRRQLAALGGTPVAGAAPDTAPDRAAVSARAGRGGAGRSTGAAGPAGRGGRGGGRPRIRNDRGGRSDEAPATPRADPDPPAPAPPQPDTRAAAIALSTTPTVALVPFVNVSRNPADNEIGAGLTAALRTRLEATDGLNTVSLTAADESTALETAEARNARWLVSGGYQRIDDQLRVTARVVEVASSDLVGTVKVDGTLGEIAALTREMVAAIGAELAVDDVDDGATPRRATARDPIRRASPGRLAVAVLPFANVSRDPADAHLGSDMADTMTGGLQQLDGVSAVRLDAKEEVAPLDAATARNATWLISGGYQHVGGQLRITARLLDVSTGELVQTVKVDGALDELPRLLAEVVATLRSALEARTSNVVGDRMSVTWERTSMTRIIDWFARNTVAANLLMVLIIVSGGIAMFTVKQEVFPEFSLDRITISVPYLGAAPAEVEEAVNIRIEEAIQGIDGIKQIISTASEGMGSVMIELELGADARKVVDDIKSSMRSTRSPWRPRNRSYAR